MPDVTERRWADEELAAARTEVLGSPAPLGAGPAAGVRADLALRAATGRPLVEAHHDGPPTASALRELCDAGADQVVLTADAAAVTGALARDVIAGTPRPCGVRITGADPRAAADELFGAGVTYYAQSVFDRLAEAPGDAIARTQYVDRLAGHYQESGVTIVRACTPSGGHTLNPPALSLAFTVIDAALAVRQGVRALVLTHNVMGNLVQDVAAVRALRRVAGAVLGELGDVELYVAVSRWYDTLPHDKGEAYALALAGTSIASLGRADVVIDVTPPDFAGGAPASIRATRQTLNLLIGQTLGVSDEVTTEVERLCTTAEAMIGDVRAAGDGDLAAGVLALTGRGLLDELRGNAPVGARDAHGAVRWSRNPMLTVPDEILSADLAATPAR